MQRWSRVVSQSFVYGCSEKAQSCWLLENQTSSTREDLSRCKYVRESQSSRADVCIETCFVRRFLEEFAALAAPDAQHRDIFELIEQS
jgi:hypothetical protein